MKTVLTASEFARSLSDIVNRVIYRGEEFIVERNGQPACHISPAQSSVSPAACTVARFDDLFAGQRRDPDPSFAADLAEIIHSQPALPPAPWK